MHDKTELRSPWLIAVWPGMGGVARIAGSHLVDQLGASEIESLADEEFFDPKSIEIRAGLMLPPTSPHGRLFAWRDPQHRRDLLVFVGDRQPEHHGYAYCASLIARARALGATRVLTFAAMASALHPQAEPRVQVAATGEGLLEAFRAAGAVALEDGQIAGLNGVLLAAADAAGLEAACLLGEMPFFASQLPNPKASRAVLELFARAAGLHLDLGALDTQAAIVEQELVAQLDALQRASQSIAESAGRALSELEPEPAAAEEPPAGPTEHVARILAPEVRRRIEELFAAASTDRRRGVELKRLLDEHGVFDRYEDRFLDIFRRG
jgi:proteasome assembly chaperone (PAC2) family protein